MINAILRFETETRLAVDGCQAPFQSGVLGVRQATTVDFDYDRGTQAVADDCCRYARKFRCRNSAFIGSQSFHQSSSSQSRQYPVLDRRRYPALTDLYEEVADRAGRDHASRIQQYRVIGSAR